MEYNKYAWRNMPRAIRHRIILADVKKEIAIVQEITKIALESDPLDKPKDFDKVDDAFNF